MLVRVSVNNLSFKVKNTVSILEACQHVGFTIPRFCYHELLAVAGNCRMCLVEIENSPKPAASCVSQIVANIKIFTETPLVKKSRENVIEMLLRNHPLDCPVCDQGGECDLQDQARLFGNNYSRLSSFKRSVDNKVLNTLIKTVMNRCIHCTRCVRFNTEIAGLKTLGVLGRGKKSEIGLYTTTETGSLSSEISGNVIDLCPVGALTSKPYAFLARPWELRSCSNIDLTDGLGSNIFIHFKNSKVFRVVPKKNEFLNKGLISDKTRFFYDSLSENKALKSNNLLKLPSYFSHLKANKNKVIVVDDASLSIENLIFLKSLQFHDSKVCVRSTNSNKDCSMNNFYINKTSSLNKTLLKSFTTYFILISINLKVESSIINAHVRSKFKQDKLESLSFFKSSSQSFPLRFASFNLQHFLNFLNGHDSFTSSIIFKSKNVSVIVGEGFNNKVSSYELIANYLNKLNKSISVVSLNLKSNTEFSKRFKFPLLTPKDLIQKQNIFSFNLEDTTNTYAHLNTTLWKKEFKKNKHFFLYTTLIRCNYLKKIKKYDYWFNPYKNSSNFLLHKTKWKTWPSSQDYEENGGFVNLEKRPQKSVKVITYSKSKVLALPQLFSKVFNANKILSLKTVRFSTLFNCLENPTNFDLLTQKFIYSVCFSNKVEKTYVYNYPNKSVLEDFYMSNLLSKNSSTLSKCSRELRKKSFNFNS